MASVEDGDEQVGAARVAASSVRRVGVVVLLAAVLIAGLIGDHFIGSGAAAAAPAPQPSIPSLAAPGVMSSTWFCPALEATPQSAALGRIVVANPSGAIITGTVTIIPAVGAPVVQNAVIQPYTRVTYKLEQLAPGPYAAATVSLDGTAGAVEQLVTGPLGQSIAPCATSSSGRWYFAAGRTDQDATELLSLYNPYPQVAIADLTFATDLGPSSPDLLQGIVVPGGGFNVVDVGAQVRIRGSVAATVTVRAGRLIVDKLQLQSGSSPHGLSLTLGATAPGRLWYYPDGTTGPGVDEQFDVYNPGAAQAQVQLAPILAEGSADPFTLTVPPDDEISLDVSQQTRIPPGVAQAWELTSTNGVPVVAERTIDAGPPSTHAGVGDSFGSPRSAKEWTFPAGSDISGADEWLVLLDPGRTPARVTVTASGMGVADSLPGGVTVPAGGRMAIQINKFAPQGVLILDVTSDVPIVAERALYIVGAPGMSDSIGIASAAASSSLPGASDVSTARTGGSP